MKFGYKTYDHGVLRPVIPVQVIYKDTIVFYEVLIDSGADSNIFSSDIADVGFLKEMGQYAYGVVGQKGFFDIFVVKFDLIKEEIELRVR